MDWTKLPLTMPWIAFAIDYKLIFVIVPFIVGAAIGFFSKRDTSIRWILWSGVASVIINVAGYCSISRMSLWWTAILGPVSFWFGPIVSYVFLGACFGRLARVITGKLSRTASLQGK